MFFEVKAIFLDALVQAVILLREKLVTTWTFSFVGSIKNLAIGQLW